MRDQPGGEENEPLESEYEPAAPPAPMAYDQALAAARQAGGTPAEPADTAETSGEEEPVEAKPAPEPVISSAASVAAPALLPDEPATPAPPAEDHLPPAEDHHPPAEDHHPPAEDHHPPAEDHHPPAEDHHPPAEDHHPPAEDHHPPAEDHHPPAEDHHPPAEDHHPPAEDHHPPAGAQATPAEDQTTRAEHAPPPADAQATPAASPRTPVERWPELTDDDTEPPGRTGRWRRALIIVLAGLFTLSACTVGGAWWLSERFAGQVHRIPRVFDQIPEQERPDKPQEGAAAKALNFLLAGTDRRSNLSTTGDDAAAPTWVAGAQRSDTIIMVHLSADRQKVYVISFPRDSWVDIPDHGLNKINAAFSLGGPTLYVRTMEQVTGIRIDHLAIIDWDGFIGLTNALGGVDVTIPETTHDSHNNRTWEAGTYHLYGADALDYVRQRYGLPRGDFDRVQRQQNFLREIMRETLNSGTLSNPLQLARVLDAVTKTVSVDDTMSNADLRGLALGLRGIRQGNVVFMTAPTTGTGYEGKASVVYLDHDRARRLFDAIRRDDVDSYLTKYGRPDERLGSTPR